MAKATGMQTSTETAGADSARVDLAAAIQGAQCAVAAMIAEIAALGARLDELVATEARNRTEHAEELARMQARCDALAVERDRAVEAADRADAQSCKLRAHFEERLEHDRAMLASIDAGHFSPSAKETARLRRARRARTSLCGEGTPGEAGSAKPCSAGTEQFVSEPASGEGVAVPNGEHDRRVGANPAPERAPERTLEHPDPIEDAVMVQVLVPRWFFTDLEREVAAGSFPTTGAALLARCGGEAPAPVVCRLSGQSGDAQARTGQPSPAPDSG